MASCVSWATVLGLQSADRRSASVSKASHRQAGCLSWLAGGIFHCENKDIACKQKQQLLWYQFAHARHLQTDMRHVSSTRFHISGVAEDLVMVNWPLSPLLMRKSSSTNVVSSWPLALSGALIESSQKILKNVNWTPTLLEVYVLRAADSSTQKK